MTASPPTFHRVFVRQDRRVAGVAVLSVRRDTSTAHLSTIHVHRPYRGAGLGSRLLSRAITVAAGLGLSRVTLEVDSGVKAFSLNAWYRRYGFVRTGDSRGMELALSRSIPGTCS